MEKFSRFTDETVGVNPFAQQPYKSSLCNSLVGSLLFLLRLPFLLVFCALLFLVDAVICNTLLAPIKPIARLVRILLVQPLARIVLFIIGFHLIHTESPHKQSIRVRPSPTSSSSTSSSSSSSSSKQTVQGGDLVLVNSCSYIDMLYLTAAFAPVFVVPAHTGSKSTTTTTTSTNQTDDDSAIVAVKTQTLYQAIRHALTRAQPTIRAENSNSNSSNNHTTSSSSSSVTTTLQQVIDQQRNNFFGAPVLFFPEGAPTNNRAILSFSPALQSVVPPPSTKSTSSSTAISATEKNNNSSNSSTGLVMPPPPKVHIVGLKYGLRRASGSGGVSGAFSPCFVAGRASTHILQMLFQPSNALTVMRLPIGYDPQIADYHSTVNEKSGGSTPSSGAIVSSSTSSTTSSSTTSSSSSTTTALAITTWVGAVRDAMAKLLEVTPVKQDAAAHAEYTLAFAEAQSGGKKNA